MCAARLRSSWTRPRRWPRWKGCCPRRCWRWKASSSAEPQAPGGFELHGPVFEILSPVRDALPFPLNKPEVKASLPVFLDHAVIGLRHPAKRSLFRLSAGVMAGFRQTLSGLGFTEIQTPKLVASATESGANVFAVDYFGQRAFLAQSPQFYKQIMVGVFERVFEVAPVFRAEPHDTIRHINEYVSLDVEMGFIREPPRRDGDPDRGHPRHPGASAGGVCA